MSTTTANSEFLLLIHGKDWYSSLSPEQLEASMNEFKTWFEKLSGQGKLKGAQPLKRDGAIVSGTGKSSRVIADGPFAESKEAVGGYFLLTLDTMDEAIAIAQSCPALKFGSSIEVRPVAEECPMMERARLNAAEKQLAVA